MANHAVARGKLTVERVIFPGPSQGNKMGEKLEGNAHWQLRARQFQRFYHATPRQKNRDLITAEHLARAKLLQPDYKLPAAAEGDGDDGEKEEAWPVTWDNPNSLRGTLNHRTWKAYPTKEATGSTKVRKAAPDPAPELAHNPPSGSASVPHELEIISEVPLDNLQHQPATETRPTPTPTTVPPDNHHVPDPPQQATAQPTPNGSLSLDPAYPSLPGNLVPAASQPGIPPAELDGRFQDVKRLLSRLVVSAKKPRHDAEPIGNEGISEPEPVSQETQRFRDDAEPVGCEGPSRWGDFPQAQRFQDDTQLVGHEGYTNWSPNLHRPYLQETQRFQDCAEPIGNEGFESGAFPQVTQTSHNGAEPVGNGGSSEGAFSQDDFRMFLSWRRERRAQG